MRVGAGDALRQKNAPSHPIRFEKSLLHELRHANMRSMMTGSPPHPSVSTSEGSTSSTKLMGDLLEYTFYIPDYQRGYRWTDTEVWELLNDLKEYQETRTKDSPPYYLQPLVVKTREENKEYEVIDGQQRLTTIGLILHYIAQTDPVVKIKNFLESKSKSKCEECIPVEVKQAAQELTSPGSVNITYETRTTADASLTDMIGKVNAETLDEYHILMVYRAIQDWFDQNKKQEQNILRTLKEHTAVIWYAPSGDAHELFQRLNIGRIPLTNAELIRALFLTSKSTDIYSEREQVLIAEQWNDIERRLADDSFWYFLMNDDHGTYDTRIDLLFETITGEKRTDRYALYLKVEETVVQEQNGERRKTLYEIWNEQVIAPFQALLRFYEDPELYHNVGYIIAAKKFEDTTKLNLNVLWKEWKTRTGAEDFISSYTKPVIQKLIGIKEDPDKLNDDKLSDHLESIRYDENKTLAHNILLLHNIGSTGGGTKRFDFCSYKEGEWSLEHIFPQTPQDQESGNEKPHDQKSQNAPKFDIHSLGNLALLSREINTSLYNRPFSEKRAKIIERINDGHFVPLCTQRVFLRFYNSETQQTEASQHDEWTDSDYKSYRNNIIATLSNFFGIDSKIS